MLINSFTLWACNGHLRLLAEKLLYKNYKRQFLWPERLNAHREWIKSRYDDGPTGLSYIPVTSRTQFRALADLGICVVYLDARHRGPLNTSCYHIAVTGVNSVSACEDAISFIANQLCKEDPSFQTASLTLLPSSRRAAFNTQNPTR